MSKLLGLFGLIAALILAACNSSPQPPNQADWCFLFDFTNNNSMTLTYGRWIGGIGYSTDENNNLGLTYQHSTTVSPILARVGIQKGSYGDLSVASTGTVFGINMENQATIPAAAPANTVFPIDFAGTAAGNIESIGSAINVTVRANGNILVAYLEVYGVGANPFGSSNCPNMMDMTYAPPPTTTPLPTSQPTWTPEASDIPTNTPSPTNTVTVTPSYSPTPTPTPTAFYYFGPITRSNLYETAYWSKFPATITRIGNDLIVGLIAVAIQTSPWGTFKINEGVDGYQDIWGNSSANVPPVGGLVQNSAVENFVRTAYPSANIAQQGVIAQPGVGTPAGEEFQSEGGGGWVEYRWVLQGWPTPTPTPSPTPTWSPTPTRTPIATNIFTQTPAGPTFTPNPRATSITAIPYLPGNTYRGPEGVCKFGPGNYLWDFRLQSAYAQGWTNPYADEQSASFQQYIGMSAPIVSGTRLARFLLNLPPGATVSNVQVYSPSGNTSWNVAGGFAASRNPNWQAAMSGSGWNSSGTLNGTSPTQIYAAVRTNNADPLHISFIAVNVSNCQATPTASATFQVQQPPVSTIVPLPTIYNWATPSGTYAVIGTPYGTPGTYGTPGPGTGTPSGTATPSGSGTPGDIPGEYGDIAELGGNILGVGGNLFSIGRGWLNDLSARVTGIVGAWNTAPVTAPPGVPLCTTQPELNQFCAILYFLRFTIFSGPIGSLIMPLATIVFDLFIVFLFIRMLRAILARLSKVTEV